MSAWESFKRLNKRRKALVIVGSPLWLPIALGAWLEGGEDS